LLGGGFDLRAGHDDRIQLLGLLGCRRNDDGQHQQQQHGHDSGHCSAPSQAKGLDASAPERSPDSWIVATAHAFPSPVLADSGSRGLSAGPGRRSPLTVARPCRPGRRDDCAPHRLPSLRDPDRCATP
jgi:hypothetical protein